MAASLPRKPDSNVDERSPLARVAMPDVDAVRADASRIVIYRAPRHGAPRAGEVTVRVERPRAIDGSPGPVRVIVTAPEPEIAERVVHDLFGADQAMQIDLCG